MTPQTFCLVGLIVSVLVALTAKPVAEFLAPKKESVSAIPRTLLSVFWMVFMPFAAWIAAIIFAIMLSLF